MTNVFDYLKWRDDIEFHSMNEVDVLIFNWITYFPWEKILTEKESLTIGKAYEKSLNIKNIHYTKNDLELFERLVYSIRYKDLLISNVVSKTNDYKEEQFMAMTIHLPKNYLYLSFRGSTNELIGWKVNLNMSFMTAFSQLDALNYVNRANITKKLYLGWHSKGGNLAMYAGVYANILIQNRIVKIFNYDGPGFLELDDKYYRINKKIISYLPSSSIVVILLEYYHKIIVIESYKKRILENNLYTWQIEKDHFITSKFNNESNFLKTIIDKFMSKVSKVDKQKLVNDLFGIIKKTGAKTVRDIDFMKIKDMLLSYRNLDEESKKLLFTIFRHLYESARDNIKTRK